jgi:hypothetical protein
MSNDIRFFFSLRHGERKGQLSPGEGTLKKKLRTNSNRVGNEIRQEIKTKTTVNYQNF